MATMTFSLNVGAQTSTETISPTNARVLEFLDDLRLYHYEEVDDGAGGTRPMTQQEVADHHMAKLMEGQVAFAKGLKQRRLDAATAVADDLLET